MLAIITWLLEEGGGKLGGGRQPVVCLCLVYRFLNILPPFCPNAPSSAKTYN